MSLTAQQTAEILGALEVVSTPGPQRPGMRRCTQVRPLRIRTVDEKGPGLWADVHVRAYSARGVTVVHDRPLGIGTRLLLQVPLKGNREKHLGCVVVRCEPCEAGAWLVETHFGLGESPTRLAG